ncbi:MAG: hypothetical protein M3322_11980 [Actinomycetota bacterium]|nr:hypothetical protein [Actinomycetota bacterium]
MSGRLVLTAVIGVLALALPAAAEAGSLIGSRAQAAAALRAAEALFERSGPAASKANPTLTLRDLVRALPRLGPDQRARAQALLDRPDDPGGSRDGEVRFTVPSTTFCTAHFCVHYVRTTVDAPPLRDGNGNGTPDWVETTASVLEFIWGKEVDEYGFRPPKSDLALLNHGPDARFDVYLAEIVDRSVLGFCAPEPPQNYEFWDVPGYCVLDNDYSPAQIGPPGLGGRIELEMTAVHEFFHAIQFAYDYGDDPWLLEGTATWVEDEVYERVNEPYRRFPHSPLRQPEVPLDTYSATRPYQYGAWVFWRFLEELLAPGNTRVDPKVIRRVWEWADGSPGAPNLYSLQAVEATLRERGRAFRPTFLTFALANLLPASFYREGSQWPAAPIARATVLTGKRRTTGARSFVLDHLTSRYASFVPGAGVRPRARLSVSVDLPPVVTGAAAAVVVFPRSGRPQLAAIPLSLNGDGTITRAFGRGTTRVVLVLTNASNRFVCGLRRTLLSCGGRPEDDDRVYRYRAGVR